MFTISAFSKLSGLSPKSLRYYHDRGLLVPDRVDEDTGYRGYSLTQLEDAVTIRVLRAGSMPSEMIQQVLSDPDRADSLITEYREIIRRRYQREDHALDTAARSMSGRAGELRHRWMPAQPYATLSVELGPGDESRPNDDLDEMNERVQRIGSRLQDELAAVGIEVTGPEWTSMTSRDGEPRLSIHAPLREEPGGPERGTLAQAGILLGTLPDRYEATLRVPLPEQHGDESIALALSALLTEQDGRRPDIRTLRQTTLTDAVEFAVSTSEVV